MHSTHTHIHKCELAAQRHGFDYWLGTIPTPSLLQFHHLLLKFLFFPMFSRFESVFKCFLVHRFQAYQFDLVVPGTFQSGWLKYCTRNIWQDAELRSTCTNRFERSVSWRWENERVVSLTRWKSRLIAIFFCVCARWARHKCLRKLRNEFTNFSDRKSKPATTKNNLQQNRTKCEWLLRLGTKHPKNKNGSRKSYFRPGKICK